MKKIFMFNLVIFITAIFNIQISYAIEKGLATTQQIQFLKKDLLSERLEVGKTRLKEIRVNYGKPANIKNTSKKVTYDYGDLKIEFEKKRYLRNWEYDYSHTLIYSDDVTNLRKDLEAQKVGGDWLTLKQLTKDYGDPTEEYPTEEDGEYSVYYYGEIKLTFENYILMKNWDGKNLNKLFEDDPTLSTGVYMPESQRSKKDKKKKEEKK